MNEHDLVRNLGKFNVAKDMKFNVAKAEGEYGWVSWAQAFVMRLKCLDFILKAERSLWRFKLGNDMTE